MKNPPQALPSPSNQAQASILALAAMGRDGDNSALDHLWQIGMLAADVLDRLMMDDSTGKRLRKLARKKTSWPFKLAAVAEIRNAKNNTANPESYAEWIGLGADTGIKLKNPGKGGTRNFRSGTASGLAYHVRRQIEADLKHYQNHTDSEILNGSYHSWSYGTPDSATGKALKSNQKKFLEYVKATRAITKLSDEGQWMKAAELWLSVAYEGKPDDRSSSEWPKNPRWPQDIYDRSDRLKRSVAEVVMTRIQEGLSSIIAPSSAKKPSV
ncbi:MAG: hypothetical protein V4689_11700 [Verrucomicrobiota bacterium]